MIKRVQRLGRISGEILRHERLRGPATLAKVLAARAGWGIEIEAFLMQGLDRRPAGAWRDSISYLNELEPGLRTLNWQGEGKQLTVDKLRTAERLADTGLPAPSLIAVVGRDHDSCPDQGLFKSFRSVVDLVPDLVKWPDDLFIKPATGWRGEGIFGARRSGENWLVDGRLESNDRFADILFERAPPAGLLVQRRLRSHPAMEPIGGALGIGALRINTALTANGPEFLFSFLKIMGSECLVDNFTDGKFGNLLGKIDPDLGELREVYGRPNGQRYVMSTIDRHPVTGVRLTGFRIPQWQEAVALAKSVTVAFPETPLIGMDIAIAESGPVVIEVQSDWAPNIAQRFLGMGLKPILRDIVPRLATGSDLKAKAAEKFGLNRSRIRHRRVPPDLRI